MTAKEAWEFIRHRMEESETAQETCKEAITMIEAALEKLLNSPQQIQPLSLDELMKLEGEPVYKVLIGDKPHWEYIGADHAWWDVFCGVTEHVGIAYWRSGHTNQISEYGETWITYRQKPDLHTKEQTELELSEMWKKKIVARFLTVR